MSSGWLRIAHRGASGTAPEQTRSAVARALEIGVDMIEVDVQVTADGHLVVLHDETLERTTNGSGAVRETPWEEIARLDAGAWFSPAFAGERVLDFDGLLAMIAGRIRLNAEIKAPAEDWPVLVPALLAALERAGMRDDTVVSSFDFGALEAVRAESRGARLGVLWYQPDLDAAWQAVERLDAVSLHPLAGLLDAPAYADARRRGVDTLVWTVNDADTIRSLVRAGAGGVMTDFPELFATVGVPG